MFPRLAIYLDCPLLSKLVCLGDPLSFPGIREFGLESDMLSSLLIALNGLSAPYMPFFILIVFGNVALFGDLDLDIDLFCFAGTDPVDAFLLITVFLLGLGDGEGLEEDLRCDLECLFSDRLSIRGLMIILL